VDVPICGVALKCAYHMQHLMIDYTQKSSSLVYCTGLNGDRRVWGKLRPPGVGKVDDQIL
jgi:hypothetical protein